MNSIQDITSKIPTNIITGFLGVGKTTAILHLLKHKPANERWAVLVNEFGEIGVDGSLVQGQIGEEQGVFIKEVPGGCMCCTAGLSMHIALNLLLSQAKPDRLLIEPTGIGHPIEVLGVLSTDHYCNLLSIQKTVTLVDARKLRNSQYTNHDTFNQQIAIADIIIGNKQDLYEADDKANLENYAREKGSPQAQIEFTTQGVLAPEWLEGKTNAKAPHLHHHDVDPNPGPGSSLEPIPESGFLKATNQGEGFQSIGWRFSPNNVFDHLELFVFLSGLNVERMKGVFLTTQGVFGYNLTDKTLLELEMDDTNESRMEIISVDVNEDWEKALMNCIVGKD